jgi:hypothetical protein
MNKRCGWCSADFGLVPGTEDKPGETTTLCPTCEALVCAQTALMLLIAADFEAVHFSELDRAEVREAYGLLNSERQRRLAVAKECQAPMVDSKHTIKED